MAKGSKIRKIVLWILVPILALTVGAASYAAYLTNTAKDVVKQSHYQLESRKTLDKSELRKKMVDPRVDNISILFLGIDDGENGDFKNTRSDAMLLATFNKQSKTIKMISIPRDSRVELVGRGKMDKITHAHAFGGLDMAVQTVEHLFDVPVDYYVRLNFDAFVAIVDTLDGVAIDVPFAMVEQNSQREQDAIHLQKGLQTLNGEEALAYARSRKYDNDFERGKRQQDVLKAIIKKALSIRSVTKYRSVLTNVGDNLTTNMSFSDMVAFHDYAFLSSGVTIDSLSLTGKDQTLDGVYYYLLDDDSVKKIANQLKEHLKLT